MAGKNDKVTGRSHEQHVEDGRKGGLAPKRCYMVDIKRAAWKSSQAKIEDKQGGTPLKALELATQNLLRKMAKGDYKAWQVYLQIMEFGEQQSSTIELTGKAGTPLIPPARTLSRKEAAELLQSMDDEY